MSRLVTTCARAGALVLAVLLLALVPDLASAGFTGRQAAGQQVSVARLATPTNLTGTYQCAYAGLSEGITVNVTGVTQSGQLSGVTYAYTLVQGGTTRATRAASSTTSATLTTTHALDLGATTYTVRLQVALGGWTTSYSESVTCGAASNASGSL